MKPIFLALLLALMQGTANAQALEFKGLQMGATIEEFKATAESGSSLTCLLEEPDGLDSCFGPTEITYAEQRVLHIRGDFLKSRLAAVTVQTSGGTAGIVLQALTGKYGNVTSKSKLRRTNPNGTHYDATMYEWKLAKGGRISLQDHPAPHNKVYVTLESSEKLAWFKKVNTATPGAKKDI